MTVSVTSTEAHEGQVASGFWALTLGGIGSSLFVGDSIVTPGRRELSALDGLKLVTRALVHYVVPLPIFILVLLFSVQGGGTARVGKAFGPVMVIWFATLAILGIV